MLVIRLARTGRKKYATYRVVAADSRRPVTAKFVAILGHYNPHTKELVLKKPEIEELIANGAKPSNSMIKLLEQEKVKLPEWVEFHKRNKSKKSSEETKQASEPVKEQASATEPEDGTETLVGTEAVVNASDLEEKKPEDEVMETAETDQQEADKAAKAQDVAAEAAIETPEKS